MAAAPSVEDATQAVDTIVESLYNGRGHGTFSISEIVKAGSLGHGIAVPGHYNVDLVIYSESIDETTLVTNGFEPWLYMLEQYLEKQFPRHIQDRKTTSRSLQFTLSGDIDVDIHVSPLWTEPIFFYDFLQKISPVYRPMFFASASKWQVEFFNEQPNQVKELIKRANAWRNQAWSRDRTGKPKSYLLAILIVRAFEIARQKTSGDLSFPRLPKEVTKEMQNIVYRHNSADIYWENCYKKCDYPDLFPRTTPRIVDPANPANNLHDTGIAGHTNRKAQDYQDGGGSWAPFVHYCISTLDLTKTAEEFSAV